METDFWVGINITWDGKEIIVKHSEITVSQLANLIYGALQKIPHLSVAMEIALDKHMKPSLMDRSIFIFNLRLLRMRDGISAVELGDSLNMNGYRINMIENNHKVVIHDYEVEAIAKFFNVDPGVLTTIKAEVTFKSPDNGNKEKSTEQKTEQKTSKESRQKEGG